MTIENTDRVVIQTTQEYFIVWGGGNSGPPGAPGACVVEDFTYAASLALDWDGVDEYRGELTGNFLPTFSGAADGQRLVLSLKQDVVGSRLVTLPANVRFGTDVEGYAATVTASKTDKLGFIYNATDAKYDLVAVVKGY